MEGRLKRDKTAIDLRTGTTVVLLEKGERVEIEPHFSDGLYRICAGEPRETLVLSTAEIDVLLTVPEVAERVDRSEGTVLRWLNTGVLHGEKVPGKGKGGQWRVPLAALDEIEWPKPGPKGGKA